MNKEQEKENTKSKRNKTLLEIGYKEMKGSIRITTNLVKGVPVTSMDVCLKNVLPEDIGFIIKELEDNKRRLIDLRENTINSLKN